MGEGLEAQLSPHFGHVAAFTVVHYDTESKEIIETQSLTNAPHQEGGCMAPVSVLKEAGANEVILGGIGMRPLMFFLQFGITPYKGFQGTVKENFNAMIKGQLSTLSQGTCGGSGQH